MTIKVNTGAGEVAVNTSRIEKFMRAESRDEALKMGAWDRFKDLFRSGDSQFRLQEFLTRLLGIRLMRSAPLIQRLDSSVLETWRVTPLSRSSPSAVKKTKRAEHGASL